MPSASLLIPLSAAASRGDQILNARSFERQGFSKVLEEEAITEEVLFNSICQLYEERESYEKAMEGSSQSNAIEAIVDLICQLTKK